MHARVALQLICVALWVTNRKELIIRNDRNMDDIMQNINYMFR